MIGRPWRIRAASIDTVGQSATTDRARQRTVDVGPVKVSDITVVPDLVVDCDEVGTGYYVHLPVVGRMEARHRGAKLIANRELAAIYQAGGGSFSGQWAAGSRVLCVRLDGTAVGTALARLPGDQSVAGTTFELAMDTSRGFGRTWVEQLLVLCRQPAGQDGLLAHPLVARPLAESLVNGFLLAAGNTRSAALAAAAEPTRPAIIQKAIGLMEEEPLTPLNVADLARGEPAGPPTRLPAPCRGAAHGLPAGCPAAPGRRRPARALAGRHRGLRGTPLGLRPPRPVRRHLRGAIRPATGPDAARRPLMRIAATGASFFG